MRNALANIADTLAGRTRTRENRARVAHALANARRDTRAEDDRLDALITRARASQDA